MAKERISREDLQGAVERVIGDGRSGMMERAQVLTLVFGLAAFGIVALAYSLGRRKARPSSAIVEVRRL